MLKFLFWILLCSSFSLHAEEIVLKWGINSELDYFKTASLDFKKRIEEKSRGRIKVEIIEIKKDQGTYSDLELVKNNQFHMSQELVFKLEKYVPGFAIWNLPFLFTTDKHIENYINSKNAQKLLSELDQQGVMGIDYTFSGGFLHIYGKDLQNFRDLSGTNFELEPSAIGYQNHLKNILKVTLTSQNPVHSEIIAAVGNELYERARKQEVHLNVTDHRVISRVLFISKNFLNSLPQDLKNLVLRESKRTAKMERNLSVSGKTAFLKEASKEGIIVHQWNKDQKDRSRELFKPLYQDYSTRFGEKSLTEVLKLPK